MAECKCKICGKKPNEISEYIEAAKDEGGSLTPEDIVKSDGTYNKYTNEFICTSCYIKIGMPIYKIGADR